MHSQNTTTHSCVVHTRVIVLANARNKWQSHAIDRRGKRSDALRTTHAHHAAVCRAAGAAGAADADAGRRVGAAIGNGGLGQPTIHSGRSTLPRRRIKRRAAPHACTASEGHSRAHCSCERAPRRQAWLMRSANAAARKHGAHAAWSTEGAAAGRTGGANLRRASWQSIDDARRAGGHSGGYVGLARKQGELTSHLQGARGDQRSAQSRLFGIVRMQEHAGARTCRCAQP